MVRAVVIPDVGGPMHIRIQGLLPDITPNSDNEDPVSGYIIFEHPNTTDTGQPF